MFSYCLCIVVTADVKEKPKKNPYLQTKVKVFIKSCWGGIWIYTKYKHKKGKKLALIQKYFGLHPVTLDVILLLDGKKYLISN